MTCATYYNLYPLVREAFCPYARCQNDISSSLKISLATAIPNLRLFLNAMHPLL